MYFENYAFLKFILSGILVLFGYRIGGDANIFLQVQDTNLGGFYPWVKDLFQCLAWAGAAMVGFVSFWGFWEKKITPRLTTWKNKRKTNRKNK